MGGTCSVTHHTLRGDRATRREPQPPGPLQLVGRGPRPQGISAAGPTTVNEASLASPHCCGRGVARV